MSKQQDKTEWSEKELRSILIRYRLGGCTLTEQCALARSEQTPLETLVSLAQKNSPEIEREIAHNPLIKKSLITNWRKYDPRISPEVLDRIEEMSTEAQLENSGLILG